MESAARIPSPMRAASARQPFDGGDGLAGNRGGLARTGILRLPVDQHHAGAALFGAAAELAAAQIKLVAQHRKQRCRAVDAE